MISKQTFYPSAVSVVLRHSRLCAGESRHPRAEAGVRSRRLPILGWLHSRPRESRVLPETGHVRSQRRMPISIRAKRGRFGR